MRPDLRGYELVIDPEVRALGIPNNDIRLLDKAIELMEQGDPDGKTILERYTLKRFATPAEWRTWLDPNRRSRHRNCSGASRSPGFCEQ